MKSIIKGLLFFVIFVLTTGFYEVYAGEDKTINSFVWDNGTYEIIKEPSDEAPGEIKLVSCDYNATELIIPEVIEKDGKKFIVTVIEFSDYNSTKYEFESLIKMYIPSTVKEVNAERWEFNGALESITFNCPISALDKFDLLIVNQDGMDAIIYVPEKYLSEYVHKFSLCALTGIYDCPDLFGRDYAGIAVYEIGADDAIPKRFSYDGLYYEVIDPDQKEVSLFGGGSRITFSDDISTTGIYELPDIVYYGNISFLVTKLDRYSLCDVRGAIRVPNSVKTISDYSIGEDVIAIYLSDSITEIPKNLFCLGENESSLTYVKLPEKLRSIPKKAFYCCKKLRGVTIPASVKKIGSNAFYKNVKTIYVLGNIPLNINKSVYRMKSTTFYIKKRLVSEITEKLESKINAGKAVIKECDFKTTSGLAINYTKIKLSENNKEKIKLKVKSVTPKSIVKIAWGLGRPSAVGSITQAGNFTPNDINSIYSYSGIYAFDILSGEFAFCDLEE